MSKREIAAAAAKKYVLSLDNATANPPADRFHSVITLITLGKAEEGENINREKFLQAILTEFFIEYPILAVPDAITDPVESRAGYTRVYEETRWWQPPHA